MKRTILAYLALVATLTAPGLTACGTSGVAKSGGSGVSLADLSQQPPPSTARVEVRDNLHGTEIVDHYQWLEDGKSAETTRWADAQDAYARGFLNAVPRRDELVKRFTDLFYLDAVSAPHERGGRFFYTRRHKDKEKAIVYWKPVDGMSEQVVIDPHKMSADGSVSVGGWYPSWDGQWIAYRKKANNADEATLHVRNVANSVDSGVDVIKGAKYAYASWAPDSRSFFYTHLPSKLANGEAINVAERPGHAEVRHHFLGESQDNDSLVFPHTGSPKAFVSPWLTRDGRYLVVYVQHGWNATDLYIRDMHVKPPPGPFPSPADLEGLDTAERVALNAKAFGFTSLAVGLPATFELDYFRGLFYARTNLDAPRYRVLEINPLKPARDDWREVVAEGESPIESVRIVGGHLVIETLENAASMLYVHNLDGERIRRLDLMGIGSLGEIVGDEDKDDIYYSFSSFDKPPQIFRTSVQSGESEVWAKVDIPVDVSKYDVEQVWYPSKDGTKVSMFIVKRRGLQLTGDHPTLLYGYGGFNYSLTPSYASSVVTWLELGGVYAVPNLRGGGEYGEAWHKAGMLGQKQNVFDDFIAAAEYLIANKYTNAQRLAIRGGSNGGLLVGAAMTQRPDLFKAVICAVPLLDMVRYQLFGSGRTWIPEYGTAENPAQFPYLHAYSPYHRIRTATKYPALLMMAADSDDRVDPMHARKFTAKLQHAQAGPAPVLMRVERNAGHGGADLVRQTVQSYADQYAFLLWQLGM